MQVWLTDGYNLQSRSIQNGQRQEVAFPLAGQATICLISHHPTSCKKRRGQKRLRDGTLQQLDSQAAFTVSLKVSCVYKLLDGYDDVHSKIFLDSYMNIQWKRQILHYTMKLIWQLHSPVRIVKIIRQNMNALLNLNQFQFKYIIFKF